MCSVFLLGGVAVLVAGGTVASAALAFPAALPGDPHHRQCKQDSQHQQGDDTAYSDHKKTSLSEEFQPQYTPSAPGEQPESAVGSNFFQKTKIWACIWTNGVV